MEWLQVHWQRPTALSTALLPFAWIYRAVVALRRAFYRRGILRAERLPVPVIVVGNITVGGTGKTPLVLWLARALRRHGYAPGVIARGYKGRGVNGVVEVGRNADAVLVGDEALVLARNSDCPVIVGRRRASAARRLVDRHACDVILADDGLQHYALGRDLEIAVLDGTRRLGNGRCLPAGPLREPPTRLQEVDLRVTHGEARAGEFGMRLRALCLRRVDAHAAELPPDAFVGQRVHALAGVGYPERFFLQLRTLGMEVIAHPFPDHHSFTAADLHFADDLPVIMTEKDAVKCQAFADPRCWYLAVEAEPDTALLDEVLRLLQGRGEPRLTRPFRVL